ncbi:MAG: OmpA family protein [Parachlamydiales bacterium]|nr:OmpA family protein [Verrucomicrobiota bacterium]MBX3718404.1 OmpA family protein [Candidatus Acheromyda pituitae]
MKKSFFVLSLICTACSMLATGCKSKNGNVWDDNQTAGNYKGSRSLWGSEETAQDEGFFGPSDEDFISLKDEDLKGQFADGAIPQPKSSPGESGSGLPGITGFRTPSGQEAAIFSNVYFNTDDHILRGKEYTAALDRMAQYLKSHPNMYIFVAGHCDERAPEAYNLALGTRRANYIRSYLVKNGVDLNRIHTISYGKERPCDLGHNAEAWAHNRRAEFKIYDKQ